MKKAILILGILLLGISVPLIMSPLYMKQSNPMYLYLAFTPIKLTDQQSGQQTVPALDWELLLHHGIGCQANEEINFKFPVISGGFAWFIVYDYANYIALTQGQPNTPLISVPIASGVEINFTAPSSDAFFFVLGNTGVTSSTVYYQVSRTFTSSINLFWLMIYSSLPEPTEISRLLSVIGIGLLVSGIIVTAVGAILKSKKLPDVKV